MMPSTYVDELAVKANAISPDEWAQTDEIRCHLETKPASLDDLKAALEELPALQAHLAWKTGYTPSKWLLENELAEVNARRKKHGIELVDSTGDAYARAAKSGLMGICFSGGGIRS